jgi:hypothetical protein
MIKPQIVQLKPIVEVAPEVELTEKHENLEPSTNNGI